MNRIALAVAAASLTLAAQQSLACGAIAFNPSNHAWGRAHDNSLAEAMNLAIRACKNSCGIYAWSCNKSMAVIVFSADSRWAIYSALSVEDAKHKANELCGANCDGFVAVGNK
jgi:hypothetical protein